MSTVSSTPILRAILRWGGIVGGVILLVAGAVGFIVAGAPGLWSGVLGVLIGVVFPALTAVTILIGNIWFGTVHYLEIFFGVVLGGWIVKLILAIVLLVALVGQPWVQPCSSINGSSNVPTRSFKFQKNSFSVTSLKAAAA